MDSGFHVAPAEAGAAGDLRNHDVPSTDCGPGLRRGDVAFAAERFAADPPSAFRSVAMEGMEIVFHRPSGITHILASPAPELIAALGDRAMTIRELLAALGIADAGADRLVAERLAELEEAGLVRRA